MKFMVSEFDLVLKNGQIIDGLGNPAFKGSLGIKDGKIIEIGDVKGDTKYVLDVEGKLVMPGFIDAHSHADLMLNWYPNCDNYLMQGCTTFVGGLCGDSPAPLGEYLYIPFLYFPLQQHFCEFFDYKYYPDDTFPIIQINEWMQKKYGWKIEWNTMGQFFDEFNRIGIGINYLPFVGHCTIRQAVLGKEAKRVASQSEVELMKEHIHQALKDGCVGLSTGVDYDPGTYADRSEVDECVSVLKEYDALYSTHWRRTGRRRDWASGHQPANPLQGIIDELETAKKTGVKIQLSHLSPGYIVNPPPSYSLQKAVAAATLEVIDNYLKSGVDVHFDVIPYHSGWDAMPYLCGLLEPWLREFGGREKLGKIMKSKEYRKEIRDALFAGKWWIRGTYNPVTNYYWGQSVKVVKSKNQALDGKTIETIAKERGIDQLEAYFDVISEDPEARGALRAETTASDAFEQTVFKHPRSMVGIDTFVYDDKYQQTCPPYSIPGTNTYGAYPSFLKRNVDTSKIMSLEEAVKKCTSIPANAHNIKDRGIIQLGYWADIIVVDWKKLKVNNSELEPRQYPDGIEYVIVNGSLAVNKGKITRNMKGQILKRKNKIEN